MGTYLFDTFFQGEALRFLESSIALALEEDGADLTSEGVFFAADTLNALIVAKEVTLVVGLPLVPMILERCGSQPYSWEAMVKEGQLVGDGTQVCRIRGSARMILKAERVILNFMGHLSGIANLVRQYIQVLQGTGTRLLDTRKTLPGLRYPEKYAVRMGGGDNHRANLAELLMLKDNHIDAAGSISKAVELLRTQYRPCPPIEVECRTLADVSEAVACHVDRIMMDNMELALLPQALDRVPREIETEVSGGVTLESIRSLALAGTRGPDFISVGRLTHSAASADFSMRIAKDRV